MALERFNKQVLILHSEQSALDNLSSGFSDRYTVHRATSGSEALNTLGETQIDVIVSAHRLPGMTGLEALREAKKRSPDTIGILLAGDQDDGLEAIVGDEEVFQVVRGEITADALRNLIDGATRQSRLLTLAESANDTSAAATDQADNEHIVMETAENGAAIVSDGTARLSAVSPESIARAENTGTRTVDVVVLTQDEEFLASVRDSVRGLHHVIHATTLRLADEALRQHRIGVAIIDASVVGSNVEKVAEHLRSSSTRLVPIVAGRRDDGEMLMDLINRGKVYRFLLKPASPGRARLAIEASVKHHLESPDAAFAKSTSTPGRPATPAPTAAAKPKPVRAPKSAPQPEAKCVPEPELVLEIETKSKPATKAEPKRDAPSRKPEDSKPAAAKITARKPLAGKPQTRARKPSAGGLVAGFDVSRLRDPRVLGVGAVAVIAVIGILAWLLGSSDTPDLQDDTGFGTPTISEADPVLGVPAESAPEEPGIETLMRSAESAILERRIDEAAAALAAIREMEPDHARLPFFSAQLAQLQLREYLDSARVAIRESRFEDASLAIEDARALEITDSTEIDGVAEELSASLSEQRVDDVLAQASARLNEGKLIAPSNDNARYYYELALSNDPGNPAAQQGLTAVAARLVLQSRMRIDAGELEEAGNLLSAASKLDPDSRELAASNAALNTALAEQAKERQEAERRAAAKRAAAENLAAENAAAERAAAERAAAEREAAERETARRAAARQAAAQQAMQQQTNTSPTAANQSAPQQPAVSGPGPVVDSAAGGEASPQAMAAQSEPAAIQEAPPVAVSSLNRIRYVAPKYPRVAQRRGTTGWVDLVFLVDIDGSVTDISIRGSEPGDVFVMAATRAVERWEFEPVIQDGVAIQKRAAVRMMFALE